MMPSKTPTNSVRTESTLSMPASSVMISELGCAYFFERTHEKKRASV